MIVTYRRKFHRRQLLQRFERAWSLNRDLRVARTGVFYLAVELVIAGDVLIILILIGGIHAQEKMIVRHLMHQDVIHETAVLVEQS